MDASTWIEAFTTAAHGTSLSSQDVETILALAGVAAHASERTAAPVTCWVAAAVGLTPAAALDVARSLESQAADTD